MKNRRMHPWGVLLALALIPAVSSAQAPDPRVQSALDEALERGIPVSLLESKVAEGRAKGIPMDRIAQAVEARLAGLARAQAAMAELGNGLDETQLAVGADALASGVSEAVLSEIARGVPTGERAVAIAALTYLVEQGTVPDEALGRVQEALADGPRGLENLQAALGPGFALPVPAGVTPGPPASIPGPGQRGPPDRPGGGGPPGGGPPQGPPGGGP